MEPESLEDGAGPTGPDSRGVGSEIVGITQCWSREAKSKFVIATKTKNYRLQEGH